MYYTEDTYDLYIGATPEPDIPLRKFLSLFFRAQGTDKNNQAKPWLDNIGDFEEMFSLIMPKPEARALMERLRAGERVTLNGLTYQQMILVQFNFAQLDPAFVSKPRPRG